MNSFLPNEFYFTIAPIAVLSLSLAAVAISYVFLLMKLNKSEKDKMYLQSKIRDHASDILKEAHEKSLKIIQEATEKGRVIIKDSQIISDDAKGKFNMDFTAMMKRQEEVLNLRSNEISKLFDRFESEVLKETEDQFKVIAKNLETHAFAGIAEFRETLESQRIFVHKQLEDKLDEEYQKAQKDIEMYKTEQMKKIDKQVFDILHALVRDVLGRSLSLKDHEDLVQKALVQMKDQMNKEM